ncbi:MAG TPA: exopolysaccharide biosynthesis protein [Xanthomonadaceae bacterium]|nr:exopolysaccharide biosynthesis protein [Xanthomonadaceae bacterium]
MPTRRADRPVDAGTRALLDGFAQGDPEELLPLSALLSGLGPRAFGMLLFVAALPAFIPIPIGGAVSGPLTMLIGAQLLVGRQRPWLPKFLATRGPHRKAMVRFRNSTGRVLGWLDRITSPRLGVLLDHRAASMFTGLKLIGLGLLLSLPIPFTNFIFGGLLLLFAIALLERDGALMLVAWIGGAIAIVSIGFLSGELLSAVQPWLDRLI